MPLNSQHKVALSPVLWPLNRFNDPILRTPPNNPQPIPGDPNCLMVR
jgi:hypothetical protein